MRVLLTGGAGYIGSACLRGLQASGHSPTAFDNLSRGRSASVPEGRLIVGDIESRDAIVKAIRESGAEAVIHFAAEASVPDSLRDPERYWRINVVGTKNVLDAMRDTGVERIVLSSTAAVYGLNAEAPISESDRTAPETPYGVTKLAAEQLVRDYAGAYGFGYAVLRYFNAAGADMDGEFGEDRDQESHLIPLILRAALDGDPVRIYGTDWDTPDGTCIRDYVHTADLMQAHRLVLEWVEPGKGAVCNAGSDAGFSVREVLRVCEQVVGAAIPVREVDRRPGDPAVLVAQSKRLREGFGWRPRHGMEDIIASAWRWHRRYPNGYRGKPRSFC